MHILETHKDTTSPSCDSCASTEDAGFCVRLFVGTSVGRTLNSLGCTSTRCVVHRRRQDVDCVNGSVGTDRLHAVMSPQWKQAVLQSLEKNSKVPFSKFFQLATVRPDGRPANRTVVYRGFEDNSESILFTTDTRSRKMEDFQKQPWGEICWYFTETREQFRLNGRLEVIDRDAEERDQEVRKENWEGLSTGLRAWFNGPPPSAPRTSEEPEFEKDPPDADEPPVASFAVVRMNIQEVDHVNLVSNQRQLYVRSSEGWKEQPLNP